MSMKQLIGELYKSSISTNIREITWIIPTVQSIHILAIAVVLGAAIVSDLRLAGVLATDESPRTIVRRHLPWMWAALTVLLLTGAVMSIGEPNRVFLNWIFWTKMALVLFAFLLTVTFRYPIMHPEFQLEHARWAALVKPMAWISLMVWVGVVICGRWIAYVI